MMRWLSRRHFSFHQIPGPNLTPIPRKRGAWLCTSAVPSFDLIPESGEFPSGWVLITGRLVRKGTDFNARLRVDMGAGFERGPYFEPPFTAKGVLFEIIWLPKGIRGLRWEPMQAPGEFEQSPIRITEIGNLEQVWRMGRRVVPLLFKQPRDRRARVGLTLRRMLFDLPDAYRLAGLFKRYAPSLSYARWLERFDTLSPRDRELIQQHMLRLEAFPLIHVLIPVTGTDKDSLQVTLQSLGSQLYSHFSITVLDPGGISGDFHSDPAVPANIDFAYVGGADVSGFLHRLNDSMAAQSPMDYIAILPAGDRLSEHALYWIADEAVDHPGTTLIYTDEDEVTQSGERLAPRFKPDWSPEHLLSTDYVGRFAVCRCREVHSAGGIRAEDCFGSGLDLLIRMREVIPPESVRHIPAILYHRHFSTQSGEDVPSHSAEANRNILIDHLARTGVRANVVPLSPGCFRLCYALPETPPLVSIIIPTRNAGPLLRRCVESVLSKSTYPCYELVVVDNQSTDTDVLAYLSDLADRPRVRVLRYDRPFNFSAINNFAARQAHGKVLCLLNNDTEVITPDWMEEMVGRLMQEGVGVVGAKLYYPDGCVQHAGDAVGPSGCADHLHSMIERDAPGYCNRAIVAQELSAVTAACLVTWKELYEQLGGLDEANLRVAFNDVDYCLRVQEEGYRIIWTPHAELYHHESASRGADDSPEKGKRTRREADFMRRRWRGRMEHDPYYNPNLNYERPDFCLSNAPRVQRPWDRCGRKRRDHRRAQKPTGPFPKELDLD